MQPRAAFSISVGFAILLLLILLNVPERSYASKENAMSSVDELVAADRVTVNRAVDAILEERKALIEKLIQLAGPANAQRYNDQTRSAACYLLGELRAIEAVPMLARMLEDPLDERPVLDVDRFDMPVGTALFKIGRPAVPALIENVTKSDSPVLMQRSLGVLSLIIGGKRRLLELLDKLNERALGENPPNKEASRRVTEARDWVEQRHKEREEPLY